VAEGIHGHEKIDRLDRDALSAKGVAEISRLLPEGRRVSEQMAATQEGEYTVPLGAGAQSATELGDHRATQRDLV
jgi:hypothetical protein